MIFPYLKVIYFLFISLAFPGECQTKVDLCTFGPTGKAKIAYQNRQTAADSSMNPDGLSNSSTRHEYPRHGVWGHQCLSTLKAELAIWSARGLLK